MSNLAFIGMAVFAVLVLLVLIGKFIAGLYQRASKERAFVRTGFGGQKVILDGGALVFPVVHETIGVNMNTLRLEVSRTQSAALITNDRMRVDVTAEFYVRVRPTREAIADAAQTLGRRTEDRESLKALIEGKFVDALRAVAAEMRMEQLHEQRVEFVQKVQAAVSEDLLKNGLELEAVSLTSLDQTDKEFFNPQNAFDAEGLTRLTEEIEARRKKRNEIEQDTEVAVSLKNLEAQREKLNISRDEEYARMLQQREVEVRRAELAAETQKEQANQQRSAKEAEILAAQQVEQAQISSARAIEEQRIEKERLVKERDIARARSIETAEVQKQESVAIADQDRHISIANKSREQSEAEASADLARAEAVRAEEAVVTVRETARAERQREIELVEARKVAQREAISVTVAAEAEKQAANDYADAKTTRAEGEAGYSRITAQGEADAEKLRAEAAGARYTVDAEGRRALNEADNLLSTEMIAMRIKLALIENLDKIIAESVKPMEAIEGIKIVQVDGLGGAIGAPSANGANGHAHAGAEGNLAEQAVGAALRYRAQAPLLDSLLAEVGISGGDLGSLTRALQTPHSGAHAATNGHAPTDAALTPPPGESEPEFEPEASA